MKFYLKPSKDSTSLIMMIIYDAQFKDGVFKYSTRERIEPRKWDRKNDMPKSSEESLTERLLELEKDAVSYIRQSRKTGLTREGLRDHLNGYRPKESSSTKASLVSEWEVYIKQVAGTVEPITLSGYINSLETFKDFMKHQVGLLPEDFDYRMYQGYLSHLRDKFKPNTVAKRLKHFKQFANYLEKMSVKIGFNKEEIEFKETAGTRIALTQTEYEAICKAEFEGDRNDARWLFILQCSTGLRISDLFRIQNNIQGNFILIETKKVKGNFLKIPITPIVRQILETYNYKLPVMYEQNYREHIKQIYKKINPDGKIQVRTKEGFEDRFIWEEISSHDAVRTFVTFCAQKGMTHASIAKIVGKSPATINKHYLVISQTIAEGEMLEKWA